MNRDVFDGKWRQLRGVIKHRWGDLTDDDLNKLHGRYDQFVGLLQEKYGHTRERAEKEVQALLSGVEGFWPKKRYSRGERMMMAMKSNFWLLLLPTVLVTIWVGTRLRAAKV